MRHYRSCSRFDNRRFDFGWVKRRMTRRRSVAADRAPLEDVTEEIASVEIRVIGGGRRSKAAER